MIHSFSAADPTDPETIAGRWLAHGAFIYFGSVNEPFLAAFRTPQLVTELLTAGIPLVAALRQGEFERFDFPWRLVYLGDPLYRIEAAGPPRRRAEESVESSESASHPGSGSSANWLGAWSNRESRARPRETERMSPGDWQAIATEYAHWPVAVIAPLVAGGVPSHARAQSDVEDARFRWCLESAIRELTRTPAGVPPASPGAVQADWRSVLRQLRRDRLKDELRPAFDDLLIDALREVGAIDDLQSRLAQIPPAASSPRVRLALETCAMSRLTRLAMENDPARGFAGALDLWDELMRLSWPANSRFPAWFTERIAMIAAADSPRRLPAWLDRLRQFGAAFGRQPDRSPQAAVVAAERARVEAQLVRH
jgi:hypothetical protein